MSVLKVLLWPLAALYNLATRLRNYLYDIGHKPSFSFESVIISIGNLNVGGSGKTPMIEYLVRLLKDRYSVAILSRGYGRKTKGFRLANDADDATTLGDEPYQYYRKFGREVMVAVGEERALAIPTLLNEPKEPQIILLDDAFQHRSVVPQFSILLTDANKPFYSDHVLPMGRLRESRTGAKRADAIIITKCSPQQQLNEEEVKKYAGDKPVFFSGLTYMEPQPFLEGNKLARRIILVTGIATSSYLQEHVSTHYQLVKHFQFGDHHAYTLADIESIQNYASANGEVSILTTEKDMVKLIAPQFHSHLQPSIWFYLPIQTAFLKSGSEFDDMIGRLVETRLAELKQNPLEE